MTMRFLVATTTLCLASMTMMMMAPLASAETDCPIDCQNAAPCVQGENENGFAGHPLKSNGSPLDFLEETSRENSAGEKYFCDCPDTFTGIRCGRDYLECADTGHYCYHGGKCLDNLTGDPIPDDQLFCDCSDASHNSIAYVGKYCEQEGAQACDADGEYFCLNGGTCKDDFQNKRRPCECPTGYRGPHCEFEQGSVPACDLDCQGVGECQLGIKDYDTALYTEFWVTEGGYMHCTCPEGYFGNQCEIEGQTCGPAHCFNGAACLTTIDMKGVTSYSCDCRTATNADDSKFAGDYCQSESTSFCSEKTNDANGLLFCTNGGTCGDESHLDCDCLDGFHGPICEFRDSEIDKDCTLSCENEGKCRMGVKDMEVIDNGGAELDGYNQTHTSTWEHCVCPEGYFGVQCEHELEICPGGDHVCLHGAKCVAEDETTNNPSHSCDCDSGFDAIEKSAGKYCQYTSTDICTKNGQPGVGKANFAFCVNSGTCKAQVEDNEPHPGCTCPDGFAGDHCEFLEGNVPDGGSAGATAAENQSPNNDVKNPSGSSGSKTRGLAIAVVVLLVAAFAITALVTVRQRKQGKDDFSINTSNISASAETEPSRPAWSDASEVVEATIEFPGILPKIKADKSMETVEII